jgi:hypothetical protein
MTTVARLASRQFIPLIASSQSYSNPLARGDKMSHCANHLSLFARKKKKMPDGVVFRRNYMTILSGVGAPTYGEGGIGAACCREARELSATVSRLHGSHKLCVHERPSCKGNISSE